MKEKLHTIPVNEAFDTDCECPLCIMYKSLEEKAIDFTMGPSYMEDDVRGETSRLGFCDKHLELLYKNQNRLGLALILQSHMDLLIKEAEKHTSVNGKLPIPSLFKKKGEQLSHAAHLDQYKDTCYICDMIEGTFDRYIATIFHLYRTEKEFRSKFAACKGFCKNHYSVLHSSASKSLSGEELNGFLKLLDTLYIENMKRVRDDLEWFINKFDYRYAEEPWKNAKDAMPRAMLKTNSII